MGTRDTSIENRQAVLDEHNRIILPDHLNEPVQLIPHQDFSITINGNPASQPVLVHKDDEVIVATIVPETAPNLTIAIAQDKLSASIKLQPHVEIMPTVKFEDLVYGPQIKIIPKENIENHFTLEKLEEALKNKGVVYGIDRQALVDILAQPDGENIVVAQGVAPQPGIDDTVTVLFESKEDDQPTVLANGRVDFKESKLTSVDMGEVLAIRLPGQAGKAGMGIDGRPINPPEHKRIRLQAGARTMLQQDGNSVVALERGMPSLATSQQTMTFQVIPILEFDDVNLATGNLDFNGDLLIRKDIAEGMTVFATGSINIKGSVYGAKVAALGDIIVDKNIISSFITAGGMSDYIVKLKDKLYEINSMLAELYPILRVLQKKCKEQGQHVDCGKMVRIVIDKKFARLPVAIKQLNKLIKEQDIIQGDLKIAVSQLEVMFRSLDLYKIKNLTEIHQMRQRLSTAISTLDAMGDTKGDIQLGYATNSNIESSGDIKISGKGCINTTISAKGTVTIDAIFRGGMIDSKQTVKVMEAGSERGVKTTIRTAGQPIMIEKAHPNVIIISGSNSRTINSLEYKVYFKDE